MNTLKTNIEEALFSKSGIDAKKSTEQFALDMLKAYTASEKYNRYWMGSNWEVWENGGVKIGKKGIEIDATVAQGETFVIGHVRNVKLPGFLISKFKGILYIDTCSYITDLEGIFTPDCEFDGHLRIYSNKNLKSLKGIPQNLSNKTVLSIKYNPNLSDIEGLPKVCPVVTWTANADDRNRDKIDEIESYMKKWDYLNVNNIIMGEMPTRCMKRH